MKVFDTIYKYNLWIFGSGPGSLAINNKPYINFLNKFLKKHDIKSVIDIGCGDWQISENIDWSGIKYLGIDTVENVIDKNVKSYTKDNIKFMCKNITEYDTIPNSELYIIKDVFQHLSNSDIDTIMNILKKKKFKYILIVNDITNINTNIDIQNGLYRPLDMNIEPFNFKMENIFEYREKLYIFCYLLSLGIMSYLVYTKTYKLYIISLIVILLYGIFLFPKKRIYLYKKGD